jgi:protein ImuB
MQRFAAIWFRHLLTDWQAIRQPALLNMPFVLAAPERGRVKVTATNYAAEMQGIYIGMPVADARAVLPSLEVIKAIPDQELTLLREIAEWCIRYTPIVAIDAPDGLLLDVSGCTHLWGSEATYLNALSGGIQAAGYEISGAIAGTVRAARALARYNPSSLIIQSGHEAEALFSLPAEALQLDELLVQRLKKLGLDTIGSFMHMPKATLQRRFGTELTQRLAQALGHATEMLQPIQLPPLFEERLPCLEPIRTANGIETALTRLLEGLCQQLQNNGQGLRNATLKCYRVDGAIVQVSIGTNRPSHQVAHLFKLFELKIPEIEPDLGIELFILTAGVTAPLSPAQEALWATNPAVDNQVVSALIDRLEGRLGTGIIQRYLPAAHYWPERSLKPATQLSETPSMPWRTDRPRPTLLLKEPAPVEVTAPIPDYPPMLFRYQGQLHHIKKADGPERIEREWWLDGPGEHRDYYTVEDEAGQRYWLFRSGHYKANTSQWFIHGFFA